MCSSQVILLKHMRLLFVELCSNDEVLRDDRILVQDEQMTSIGSGNVCYQQVRRRVVERIWLWTFGFVSVIVIGRLLCQCRAVTKLELIQESENTKPLTMQSCIPVYERATTYRCAGSGPQDGKLSGGKDQGMAGFRSSEFGLHQRW